MKHFFAVLAIGVFVLLVIHTNASSQIPSKISIQGLLVNQNNGQPVNGPVDLQFKIYDIAVGGTELWSEIHTSVALEQGTYKIFLGSITPLTTIAFNKPLYLEMIRTDTDPDQTFPREDLTTAPYAFQSVSLLGLNSVATGTDAIAGGTNNRARGIYSVVSGGGGPSQGDSNSASGNYSTVSGGKKNKATDTFASIGGGSSNDATNNYATVSGGSDNIASGYESTVSGGLFSFASGNYSTVAGGGNNRARGLSSVVSGGGGPSITDSNSALGDYSTVPGGWRNLATGDYSFAAGRNAKADHSGSFVWNSNVLAFHSTTANEFSINASGGTRVIPKLDVRQTNDVKTVEIAANAGTDSGGQVYLYDPDGTKTIELDGRYSSGGGVIDMFTKSGTTTVLIRSQEGTSQGAQVSLYRADGSRTIELDAEEGAGGGGDISLWNNAATPVNTIQIDADYAGTGVGRIITDVLEIKGGSDLSEQFNVNGVNSPLRPEAGMIVSIDPAHPGELLVSSTPYDRTVAGIISGAGGVKTGMLMGQTNTLADGRHPVALSGRVYCWAEASEGPIQPGDLLTTSDIPGHAMKVADFDKAHGAIIGKAMTALTGGRGLVLVLVSLQ